MTRLILLAVGLLFPVTAWAQSGAVQTARAYLQQHADRFGIEDDGLEEAVVTDAYRSTRSGVTHVYFQQQRGGIEVVDGRITVNIARTGDVLLAGGRFMPGVSEARGASPSLSAEAAVGIAASHLGLSLSAPLTPQQRTGGPARAVTFSDGGFSKAPIPTKLVYQPVDGKTVRLAWNVEIEERAHDWAVRVDAATGEVLLTWDQVVHDHWGAPPASVSNDFTPLAPAPTPIVAVESAAEAVAAVRSNRSSAAGTYRVFDSPVESPIHGDRTIVTNPADPTASPLGWHDDGASQYTTARGNNVWAYVDANNADAPSGTDAEPDGSPLLLFDFPADLTQQPDAYRPAAVTNLFYWGNLIHDVLVGYGFDEQSGNFQNTNFTADGLGGDALRMEAQDGSGTNNANYSRSPDGGTSRVQMYIWNLSNPNRDGDFDNGIIVHEYGHGVTIRITGGPSTDQCLSNSEQMGEGWSDWYGLMFTMEEGDTGADGRGIGTYALNQPTTGVGIRPARYSTDESVNGFTYGDIGGLAVPHGVGFVWSTMLWEMTWNLIDVYGFDSDLHTGTGGNNLALELVTEALKMQPCSPGFVDGRDAILAADQALYDGANAVYIWEAFAKRGLGFSASQGSPSNSSDGTEAFDLPPGLGRFLSLDATPDPVNNYQFIDYTLTFGNGTARDPVSDVVLSAPLPADAMYVGGSASDGGTFENGVVTFPAFDAATGSETVRTFRLLANAAATTTVYFSDDMEDGGDNWSASHGAGNVDWTLGTGNGTDGSAGWFAQDVSSVSDQYLDFAEPLALSGAAELRFAHRYATESSFDGGVVEISTDEGSTWQDLGPNMVENGYNGSISTQYSSPIGGREAFTGSSGGYIVTVVDLTDYVGEEVLVRFRMATDVSVSSDGWYVDNVEVGTAPAAVNVEACAGGGDTDCAESRVLVLEAIEPAPAVAVSDDVVAAEIPAGSVATFEISVSNDGEGALDWQIGSPSGASAAWFSADPVAGTVEAGASQTVTLTLDATDLSDGIYEDLLAVYANDPEALTTDLAVSLLVGTGTASEDDALAEAFRIGEVYPNPFSGRAQFTLEVAEAQDVRVAVYDVMGRAVAVLHDGLLPAGGQHDFAVDGRSLASGVYLIRVTGDTFAETQRITLLN